MNPPLPPSIFIYVYESTDPNCPPEVRAAAHVYERDPVSGRLRVLPATQIGPDGNECATRLSAFLEAEIARERRRAENAAAAGVRKSAYWAAKRGAGG